MRLEKSTGLKVSEEVLKRVKQNLIGFKQHKLSSVYIGCFTNCRECGLTYMCANSKGDTFTFCTYEHRNSDQIIVNGTDGYVSMNGDLPYASDSKYDYIKSFSNEDYDAAAKYLADEIKKFVSQ